MRISIAMAFGLISTTLLLTCSKPGSESGETMKVSNAQLTLAPDGTIDIPIDSTCLNQSLYPVYYVNDTVEYYIAGNEYLNSIDFFDLKKKKLVKRNFYPKKGHSGIDSPLRIFVKSLDSIYMYSKNEYQMVITNFSGDFLGRYNVNVMAVPNMPATSFHSNLFQPFQVIGPYAYFGFMLNGDPRYQPGHKTLAKYHLVSNEYEEFAVYYPQEFKNALYDGTVPYFTFGHANTVTVRFGCLPYLYHYDVKSGATSVFSAKSTYQDTPIVPDTVAERPMDMDRDFEQLRQDSYGGIFYDRFAHVYYSLFLKGIPIYDSAGNKNSFERKPVSIMIFNEDFEFCGEHRLKENTYFWRNIIPTKHGLLIPTSHPENPNSNPQVLQFQIFKLVPQ